MNAKLLLASVAIAFPIVASAQLNFNFSGFATGYSNDNIDNYQEYLLAPAGTIANNYNGAWITNPVTMPDNTQVPFMLVNGGAPSVNLWSESMDVTSSNETFNFMGTALYSGDTSSSGSAATIQLLVDGNAVGASQQIVYNDTTPGQLSSFSVALNGIAPGIHTISMADRNGMSIGNDFALAAPAAVPEPSSFAGFGIAGLGFLIRRKTKRSA